VLYLLIRLRKPLLIEGHAGVGKTEVAKVLAAFLGVDLIRLQCYEGLDVNSAVYEWNYQKQLLAIKIHEGTQEEEIFSAGFLLERPLLRAIRSENVSPVLLIDEIDRADEEFEGLLLEVLSDFQVTVPELGPIRAQRIPLVVITSNRTRDLSDALRRRCLYYYVDYPSPEKETAILERRLPGLDDRFAREIVAFVQRVRREPELAKRPGIAETLDWTAGLLALGRSSLDAETLGETLGLLVKDAEDLKLLAGPKLAALRGRP